MSASDVPVHVGLGGRLAGTFVARPGARRLAGFAARWVLAAGTLALLFAMRHPWRPGAATVVVWSPMCAGVAVLGLAIRRAKVTVDGSGVRWGWDALGFRLERDRIRKVDVYDDAIAFRQRRSSTWFLTAWDWDRFDALALAVERSGLPLTRAGGRAPLGARLQSYGRVLDAMLILAMLGEAALAIVALTL